MSSPQSIPEGSADRILLTGSSGQLGSELLETLASLGAVYAPARHEMDLADPATIRATIRSVRPGWIVNPAAFTAVDKAESEAELAHAINAQAVGVIGAEARAVGAAVIHYSTDYVFNGNGSDPYHEGDPTAPLNVYGETKLEGERLLAESGAPHLIFRTSWVYGATGKNFLLTIRRLAQERESLQIVADQRGSPTWSRDLAVMTCEVMKQCEARTRRPGGTLCDVLKSLGGVYHATGTGYTTWCEFAVAILEEERKRDAGVRLAKIHPIRTEEYPTPARRPKMSELDCSRLREVFRYALPHWRESLTQVMSRLHAPACSR